MRLGIGTDNQPVGILRVAREECQDFFPDSGQIKRPVGQTLKHTAHGNKRKPRTQLCAGLLFIRNVYVTFVYLRGGRSSFGRATFTTRLRPPTSFPLNISTAFWDSS